MKVKLITSFARGMHFASGRVAKKTIRSSSEIGPFEAAKTTAAKIFPSGYKIRALGLGKFEVTEVSQ